MIKTSAILVFLVLVAFVMRIYHIDAHGLSKDETLTLCRINGVSASLEPELTVNAELPVLFTHQTIRDFKSYNHVVDATISDSGNALAYNVFLSYWTRIFGDTNTAMRMMSLIFGILTVILGYYFCRQLFNERTANIAGLLLCCHPVLIEYGQMARSYVPAAFLILLTTYSIYQVSVAKKHTWLHIPLYVIALNLSLLTHYVTVYVFISHIFLVAIFHSHRKALVQYAIMAILGFGLFSIWLFNGGWEGKRPINIERSMWLMNLSVNGEEPVTIQSIGEATFDMGMNWVRIFGNDLEPSHRSHFYFLLMLALPAIAVFFVFRKVRKSEYFRPVMFVTFPFVMYSIYVIIMAGRTGHSIPFDIRYSVFVIPFACLLLAFGFDRMIEFGPKMKVTAYGLLFAIVAFMVAGFFPGLLRDKNVGLTGGGFAYHHAADYIEKSTTPADTIVFQNSKDAVLTNFYVSRSNTCVQLIDPMIEKNILVIRQKRNDSLNDRHTWIYEERW